MPHRVARQAAGAAATLKLIEPVPHRPTTHTGASSSSCKGFRQRYDELEARRFEPIARLTTPGENARRPAWRGVLVPATRLLDHAWTLAGRACGGQARLLALKVQAGLAQG